MWVSYEQFASSTELHGFDMILRYKSNRFWAAVWAWLTIMAVGMCINDAVNLAILYQSEPTATSVSLKLNLNLTLPNPTLCMDVHVDGPMLVELLQNYERKIPSETFTKLTSAQIQDKITTDLDVFLQVTQNAENLDIPTYDQLGLSVYLEYYTYMMLSHIAEGELKYLGYNNSIMMLYDNDYVAVQIVGFVNVNPTIGYLYSTYMSRNVSVANLQRLVGMSICQKRTESLIGLKDGVTETLPICKPSMITHLSFSRVCSKLFEDETHQLSDYDSLTLSGIKVAEIVYPFTDLLVPLFSFLTNRIVFTWYLDFHGRATLPLDSREGIFGWNPTGAAAIELSVAAEYQIYNANLRPCSDAELTDKCDWRQRVEKLQNTCGCRPSILTDFVGDILLPICGQDHPRWNLRNDTVNSQLVVDATYVAFCTGDIPDFSDIVCTPNCRIMTLATQSGAPTKMINTGIAAGFADTGYGDTLSSTLAMPAGLLEFSLKTAGSHPYFEELPTKDISTFICDFGGSIGAWLGTPNNYKIYCCYTAQLCCFLGASLMAFIHAVIHIFLTCRNAAHQLNERKNVRHD